MSFEHMGLSRIRRLNATITKGCLFQNFLVIQQDERAEKKSAESLFSGQTEALQEILDYGLVMECILEPEGVQLRARYDPAMIDALQIERLLQ